MNKYYATFRFNPESQYKDNYVLVHAKDPLEALNKLRKKFPDMDMIVFATRALARVDEYELTLLEEIE